MKRNFISYSVTAIFLFLFCTGFGFSEESSRPVKPASDNALIKKLAIKSLHNQSNIFFYTAQPGDSLYRIAQTYDTTIAALKKANNLKSALIHVGQELYIPILPGSIVGDALESLNQAFDTGEDLENSPLHLQLLKTGIGMLGIRYLRGGSRESGFDCSGLVKNLFSRFDIELPRSSRQQYRQGEKVDRNDLEIGDLVFFSSSGKQPDHVGIYIGENKFLHAALKAKKVIISDLNKPWYAVRFIGGRRIGDLWEEEKNAAPQETAHYAFTIKETNKPLLSHTLMFTPEFIQRIHRIELSFDGYSMID